MAGRSIPVSVTFLGNTSDLEAALTRAGVVADESSKKIAGSADMAARAAAEQARAMGLSADEQEKAASKAAVAFTQMSARITAAQRAAGEAAAMAARQTGASLDEQKAAYTRAIAQQSAYEDAVKSAQAGAAEAAKASAKAQADSAKLAADAQAKSAEKSKAAQKALADFGGKALMGGVAAGGAAAFEGVKGFMALQKQMEMLHTQAGATQAQVGTLTKGIEGMAASVGTAPLELAQGMYHVVSSLNATLPAAQRASTELQVLRVAAEGARIGGANLEDVTNALDAAVVSGVRGVQNYGQAMGALNAIVGAGDMKMQNLADALGTGLLGPMKTYGLSLKDVGGALAVFGDNNIRGADAATKLSSAVRIMAAPSAAASKALAAINLSTLQLANDMRSGGLVKALSDLKQHLQDSGATASQQGLIIARAFGGRQSTGVQLLLGQLDRLKAKTQDVGAGATQFGGDWKSTTHTLSFQFDQLKAEASTLADKFGGYLVPKLEAVAQATEAVIGWVEKHKTAAEALGIVISGALGTAISVYAYTKAAAFVTASGKMFTAVGDLATGAGKSAVTIATKLGLIAPAATEAEAGVVTADEGIVASADTTAAGVDAAIGSTGIGLILVGLGVAAAELGTHWGTVMSGMKDAVNAMVQAAETALNGLISALNGAISLFNSTIGTLTGDIGKVGSVGVGPAFGGSGSYNGSAYASKIAQGELNAPLGVPINPMTGKPLYNITAAVPSSGSNWQRIAGALAGQGFSKIAIAGILGNFAQETGGGSLSGINTRDSGTGASGMGGMGIAQWTAGRRVAEMGYAQQHHESPTSLAAQIGFLVQELRTNYHGAYNAISGATTPQQAAHLFDQLFEGGTDPNGIRESAAGQAYGLLTAGGGGGASGSMSSALQQYLNSAAGGGKGKAAATSTIPVAVATMLQTAQSLIGTPYSKTGHGMAYDPIDTLKKIGIDCSGFVSRVLHSGGVNLPISNTATLPNYLQKGAGKYVTVYDRNTGPWANQHTLIDILGHFFESGGSSKYNPSSRVTELSKAQAAGELAGGGFNEYHPVIGGPMATVKQLRAMGISGSLASANSATASIQSAINAIISGLVNSANSLLTRYGNVEQSGTLRTLTSALGASTGSKGVAGWLHNIIEHLGTSATVGQISATGKGSLTAVLSGGVAKSQQGQQFETLLGNLMATGQTKLADRLVSAHKAAMATLAQEMYAQQALKDGETLAMQATNDRDLLQLAQDTAAKELQVMKDQATLVHDQATAQTQAIKDMATVVHDQMAGVATALKDATTLMSDQSSGIVAAINDQTQTQVDQIGERGLYGLHLIAQQLQVKSDQDKSYWDQQINSAQQQLDALQAQADAAESAAQIGLDQATAAQDQLVALAQQNLDTVTLTQNGKIAAAQAHLDAVQAHVDATLVGPAQMAVDMGATLPKAQQDVLNAQLKRATGQGDMLMYGPHGAQSQYNTVYNASQSAIQGATGTFQSVQDAATQAIQSASLNLQSITDNYTVALAQSAQGLQGIQNQAAQAEAQDTGAVSIAQARANAEFAGGGFTINLYGVPMDNAGMVGNSVAMVARTLLSP